MNSSLFLSPPPTHTETIFYAILDMISSPPPHTHTHRKQILNFYAIPDLISFPLPHRKQILCYNRLGLLSPPLQKTTSMLFQTWSPLPPPTHSENNFYAILDLTSSPLPHRKQLLCCSRFGLPFPTENIFYVSSPLLHRKLRKSRPQQTLFQLCLALLLSWLVFLAGIERTSDHEGCLAVAAILHYLILASFMWMLMEGLLQYLLFLKVMKPFFNNYMLKTSIISWGEYCFNCFCISPGCCKKKTTKKQHNNKQTNKQKKHPKQTNPFYL